jgi:amino acid adenylation domain-containing protein
MQRYIQQQLLSRHADCPFFDVAHPCPAESDGKAVASATLPETLNRRLFCVAAASALHRLSLFSACIRHLAFLHGRQPEGSMLWAVRAADILNGQGGDSARAAGVFVVPRGWRISGEDLDGSVKSLFGSELTQWKHLQSRLTGMSPGAVASLTVAPLEVLVVYSEAGAPLEGVDAAAHSVVIVIDATPERTRVEANCAGGQGDPDLASRLVDRLQTLLAALVGVPDAPLASVSMLAGAERAKVLQQFNDTDVPFPEQALLHGLIEEQVRRSPRAPAVVFDAQVLSYTALNARANQLARLLRMQMGIVPDARVAVCMERSVEMLVALLAVLKAGGAYVPLDPHQPAERMAYMLQDVVPQAVLTHGQVCGAVREVLERHAGAAGELLLDLNADAARWSGLQADDLEPAAVGLTSAHLAYVIYTSGSTGRPKGVMNEHRGVVNRLIWLQKTYGLDGSDAVLQKTPFSFDVSVMEFFWPLMVGARVVMARPEGHKDPAYLGALIEEQGITTLHFVPSMLPIFLELAAAGMGRGLRRVFCSGEALPARSVRRFLERFPQVQLHNQYGPTEVGETTAWDCGQGPLGEIVSIGRPIDNTRIYLLDAHGRPTPLGVAGELYIAGASVARGYLNRPELTAERFLPDPFGPWQRMYRTGDLARYLASGDLEYLGRNDFQVKLRGFRVEIGEIEAVLAACPGVREAVVVARPDSAGELRLVAYVLGDGHAALSAATLRPQLARELADYMLPTAYVVLDALPLTANGKLDRNALPPPPEAGVAAVGDAYQPPQGLVEEKLAQLWCHALGVERVGRDEHFFELGGHSLRAVRMLVQVEKEFGQVVPLLAFFNNDTLGGLAAILTTGQSAAGTHALARPPLVRLPRERPLPASLSQRRLWFLDQLDPAASMAYHVPIAVRLSGALDRTALKAALDAVVARHESLRTRFLMLGETPHQVFESPLSGFQLVEHDLTRSTPSEQELEIARHMAEEFERPFDLAAGPLIRGRLLRLSADEHALLINQHHINTDGWSLQVLAREVSALYATLLDGQSAQLPSLPLQYADYAAWQDGWLQGELLHQGMEFWRAHLDGAPALLELPVDRPRPKRQSYVGASVPLEFPDGLAARLRKLGQQHGCTVFMVFLAGWSALLSRLSGQEEVVVGIPVTNRSGGAQDAIGLFVNTIALRIRPMEMPSGTALLQQARAVTLAAFDHQSVPFEQVVEALRPQRSLGYSPLFQTMLAVESVVDGDGLDLSGLTLKPLAMDGATTRFDISLDVEDDGAQMSGAIQFAVDLFDRATVERWGSHLMTLLAAMADDPHRSPKCLPLLTSRQQQSLLAELNDTKKSFPGPNLIHGVFEAQARRHPDALAVISGTDKLTYAELNAKANRLAHVLLSKGVAADQRVAMCAGRNVDMLVGLLAILKAGGAYVPLDPAYPDDRLRFMLADSEPVVLLAQASLAERFESQAAGGLPVVMFDDVVLADMPDEDPDPAVSGVSGNTLAYVIYTSGSTGRPKGVMVEHASVVNLMHAHAALCGLRHAERLLQFASCSFDMSVEEIFPAFVVAATLVLRPADMVTPDEAFIRFLDDQRIDVVDLTTAFWHLWATEVAAGRSLPGGRLRLVVVGGEKILCSYLDRWLAMSDRLPCRVLNTYGPTEATAYVTAMDCGVEPGRFAQDVPIGTPIANTRVYVLDRQGAPVPVGVVGEIHIGGIAVARGYLNRRELTAERFLCDPFSDGTTCRMYRTGDLGRWSPDGTLGYLGRNDSQVKVRGYRIELGEVEASLAACPGVSEAVVLVREDQPGDTRLVAYVVAHASVELSESALREHLSRGLPAHMVPAAYVFLPSIPLTPNGKLNRKALPPPGDADRPRHVDEPPQGRLEQALADIWQKLLRVHGVGRRDNFFELGGYSLLAVSLMARIRDELGIELPIRQLFATPRLEELATFMQANLFRNEFSALVPIRPRGGRPPLFLVHPGEGEIGYARVLAKWLDVEIPIYGFAAAGFMPGERPHATIEAMASSYLHGMRSVQPRGPYRIAGWSLGGTIAYEMADQLIVEGECVQFLGLIDTPSNYGPPPSRGDVEAEVEECRRQGLLPGDLDTPTLCRHVAVRAALVAAACAYVPRGLPITAYLFSAAESAGQDLHRAWHDLTEGDLRHVTVPGTHYSMVEEPNARSLAEAIGRQIMEMKEQGAISGNARTRMEQEV